MSVAQMPESIHAFLAGFQFVRPWWLFALALVPVLPWWLHRRRLRRNVWREAVDAHLLQHLIEGGDAARSDRFPRGYMLATLAATLTILALAGPSWRSLPQPLWQDRTPLVVAVDLSEASTAADLPPSRLLQMRAKLTRLLRERGGGQIALVAFADDAYIVSPLTDDAANIELFVDALSPEVMPEEGQRADRAVRESVLLLERAGFARGDILLMTHRADSSARKAAAEARAAGFRVSVLGLGTAEGGSYLDRRGRSQRTAMEAAGLRATADAGDGRFVPASVDDSDLRALGVLRADRVDDAVASERRRGALALDEGFWLLPPLLLLGLFAFRRGVLAVALLAFCLPWQVVRADEGTLWQRSDQVEHARLQQGVAAYRAGDYKTAMSRWTGLPGADAAYNRGNALARQGRYDEAIAEYDRALRLQPGMADAAQNRRVTAAAREQRAQQQAQRKPDPAGGASKDPAGSSGSQGRSGQESQGKDSQGKDAQPKDALGKDAQPKDAQANPSQGKDAQADRQRAPQAGQQASPQSGQQGGKPGDRRPAADPSSTAGVSPQQAARGKPGTPPQSAQAAQAASRPAGPQTPADLAAQRQADAAQRERMKRAQAGQPPIAPGAPSASGTTSTERSAPGGRRLANEAWLRRVPDDPGGLLREKFKLEERRRRREDDR